MNFFRNIIKTTVDTFRNLFNQIKPTVTKVANKTAAAIASPKTVKAVASYITFAYVALAYHVTVVLSAMLFVALGALSPATMPAFIATHVIGFLCCMSLVVSAVENIHPAFAACIVIAVETVLSCTVLGWLVTLTPLALVTVYLFGYPAAIVAGTAVTKVCYDGTKRFLQRTKPVLVDAPVAAPAS